MTEHDILCPLYQTGKPVGSNNMDCRCGLIALVRDNERQRIADRIHDLAFHVFVDTDGDNSIKVHLHYEGLTLAEQLVRETPYG